MSAPFLGDRRAILFSNNLQYEVCHIWCCFINIRWITWNKSIICDWISSIEKRNIVSERPSSKCIEWNIARRLSVTSSCKISSEKLSCIWMITVIDYIKVMIAGFMLMIPRWKPLFSLFLSLLDGPHAILFSVTPAAPQAVTASSEPGV